jgi:hypothetical protein
MSRGILGFGGPSKRPVATTLAEGEQCSDKRRVRLEEGSSQQQTHVFEWHIPSSLANSRSADCALRGKLVFSRHTLMRGGTREVQLTFDEHVLSAAEWGNNLHPSPIDEFADDGH